MFASLLIFMATPIFLVSVFLFSFMSVLFKWDKFSSFVFIVGVISAYLIYQPSLILLASGSLLYLILGVVWSFYRYKNFVQTEVDLLTIDKSGSPRDRVDFVRDHDLKRLHPINHVGTIVSWILVWPFSVVENLSRDITQMVSSFVKSIIKSTYLKIFNEATSRHFSKSNH